MQQELEVELTDKAQRGRILHFVIDKGYSLQCRPAMVVEDWPESGRPGYVNLVIFIDGSNDDRHFDENAQLPCKWETSVLPNHLFKVVRTWHWPRECDGLSLPADPFVGADKKRVHHNHGPNLIDENNCYACMLMTSSKASVDGLA